MGDTGSMALGGALAGLAVMTQDRGAAVFIGGIYLLEALSVIIQVVYVQAHRQARLPDGADPPPLRDEGVVGDEDHGPLLDRLRDPLHARLRRSSTATTSASAGCHGARWCSGWRAPARRATLALRRRGVEVIAHDTSLDADVAEARPPRCSSPPRRGGPTLLDGVDCSSSRARAYRARRRSCRGARARGDPGLERDRAGRAAAAEPDRRRHRHERQDDDDGAARRDLRAPRTCRSRSPATSAAR